MADDVLSNEVSVGVSVATPTGLPIEIKGKTKSRFISAADRLAGNIIDYPNAWLEAKPAKKRAETQAAVQAILGKNVQIHEAFVQAVEQAVRNQEKKILLLQEAMEDLKQRPPNTEEMAHGAERLDEGFLNRLEKRAEEATEEEIRAKWSRILAAEIRRPGTFSAKVMRIVDETDKKTAELFENICQYRIGNAIPICLCGYLGVSEGTALEDSGLIIGAKSSIFCVWKSNKDDSGDELWFIGFGEYALSIPKTVDLEGGYSKTDPIAPNRGFSELKRVTDGIQTSIYGLTTEGTVLASIFGDKQEKAFYAYLKKVSEFLPDIEVKGYRKAAIMEESHKMEKSCTLTQIWKNGMPLSHSENIELI